MLKIFKGRVRYKYKFKYSRLWKINLCRFLMREDVNSYHSSLSYLHNWLNKCTLPWLLEYDF